VSRHLYIVTGASRGLGAAIADQLLAPGNHLLCLARRTRDELAERACTREATCEQWSADLSRPVEVATRLEAWLKTLDAGSFASASLINNAGVLTRIGPIDDCSGEELSAALRVGVEAPLLLSAAFLRATNGWSARRRILNISSGLGRRAMAGQAAYCAAKAGLDHMTRAMALDEAHRGSDGAAVVSLAPGVIDTEMQVQLRSGDAARFPERELFVGLKSSGRLASAEQAAAQVIAYLQRPDFGSEPIADVRDA
jgi:NAD(P)-dependent dehydrogenase (short-subunit alcohol dehydrogenase family)